MSSAEFNPRRLDVAAFAQARASLGGEWPGDALHRLQHSSLATDDGAPSAAVQWDARGELRGAGDGLPRIGLSLSARTSLRVQCQRCLQPMTLPLHVQARYRFAADEAQAEQLDPDSDDDILALPRSLDLQQLVEDELILALPPFPRHDRCDPPGPTAVDAAAPADAPHPFAVLQALRGNSGDGPA